MNVKYNPKTRNGPKASSFVFLVIDIYKAYGSAQVDPMTIDMRNRLYGSIEPIRKASFISPPPSESRLKAASPRTLTTIMSTKANTP